jgi:hypothetical protein
VVGFNAQLPEDVGPFVPGAGEGLRGGCGLAIVANQLGGVIGRLGLSHQHNEFLCGEGRKPENATQGRDGFSVR